MKSINYTGTSKLIARIVQLLNRKAPLPLDGDGDADWGTNGQVLTTDGNGNTSWTTPQGGGGDVTDVEVNGTSVVNAQGVAEVSVPTNTSDLNNDSGFIDGTDLSTALSDYTPTSSLATVATSGDYDDLTNKPTIPAAQIQSDWNQSDTTAKDYIKNKPTIPSSSGHTIWNRIKSALTARGKLWFADASVSDVSADDATKVEVVTELASESDFDNLPTDGTADGAYCFPNSGDEYLTADNVAYDSNDSVKEKIDSMNFIPVEKYSSGTCADMYADYGDFTFGAGTVDGGVGKDTPTTSTAWRILQTRLDAYAGIQFAYHTDTDDAYMRRKESGVWSNWVRLALASDLLWATETIVNNPSLTLTKDWTEAIIAWTPFPNASARAAYTAHVTKAIVDTVGGIFSVYLMWDLGDNNAMVSQAVVKIEGKKFTLTSAVWATNNVINTSRLTVSYR